MKLERALEAYGVRKRPEVPKPVRKPNNAAKARELTWNERVEAILYAVESWR